jgi:chorismate mutase/prephenate dehydratase
LELAKKDTKDKAAPARGQASLAVFRRRLDRIDAELLKLLSERTSVVLQVKEAKQATGGRIWVPEREAAQLQRLSRLNRKSETPVPEDALSAIFGEVLSASRALQRELRVAYLGPEGTYSEMAAHEHFGSQAEFVPVSNIAAIFDAVEKKQVELGVVPFENSTEGIVGQAIDAFVESPLRILGERQLDIRHALLGHTKNLGKVRRVLAHPQAIAQCRNWLEVHLPHAELREVSSNAAAAQQAARTKSSAAIASASTASRYGLEVLQEGIQDLSRNVTRFVVVGDADQVAPVPGEKISILFSVKNEVGVLARILAPLARAGIDVLKVESRPKRGHLWDYVFFMDLCGDLEDRNVGRAVAAIRKHCVWLKVLGSYAAAQPK